MEIIIKCNKCGKKAEKNQKESNKNWEVFDNLKCECGGKFCPTVKGDK